MSVQLTVAVFVLVYLGMALGRWPGLALDRTGVAVIGAIVLFVFGGFKGERVLRAIDFPTLSILFSLMVLSAQVAASGFFDRCGQAISTTSSSPRAVLGMTVVTAGAAASVLTNDVVVWALTPVLIRGLRHRELDPRPYVIALACSANAGSAATVIGNPQNLLIGQVGGLSFWTFLGVCGVPAIIALGVIYGVIAVVWRKELSRACRHSDDRPVSGTGIGKQSARKAVLGLLAVIAVFSFAGDRASWTLAVAGALLLSRTMTTRRMLSMVDWHLLLLFGGLFVVTGSLSETGVLTNFMDTVRQFGIDLDGSGFLGMVSLFGSNSIGNVPLVVLVLSAIPGLSEIGLYSLALFSTLSGNLLIIGSIANIIAVERASLEGVKVGFFEYARIGIPVTMASLIISYAWMTLVAPMVLS